jgi:hypothetical protein
VLAVAVVERKRAHIRRLEGSLEDGNCVILSCDIVEALGSTDIRLA